MKVVSVELAEATNSVNDSLYEQDLEEAPDPPELQFAHISQCASAQLAQEVTQTLPHQESAVVIKPQLKIIVPPEMKEPEKKVAEYKSSPLTGTVPTIH